MLPGRNFRAYITRVKNTSWPEIAYRVNRACTALRMRINVRAGKKAILIPLLGEIRTNHLRMPSFVMGVEEAVIGAIRGGKVFTLNEGLEAIDQFEAMWCGTDFAGIRTTSEAPDIRMVWEPARLQHLTILMAHVHHHLGNPGVDAVKSFVGDILLAWIRHNPFLKGPHYMSPMECGLRIPVFFYALKTLDNLTTDERRGILEALYLHAWWVSRNLSLYSSLGNHTICECVGLLFAGAVFKETPEGRIWWVRSIELLRQELVHQILPDGGPAEQSSGYHRFVLDLYWLVLDFLETNGLHDCSDFRPRLALGEAFLGTFQDGLGRLPSIGDSDDGHAVAPGVAPKRETQTARQSSVIMFSEAGYTIIKTVNDCRLIFDHGPLGMPPLYNHGHADALSVVLNKSDLEFLVDPGTYRYNGVPEYRNYFKGTRAHNTVTIDGRDQAVQETGFIWSRPYSTDVTRKETIEDGVFIEALHTGYRRLKSPVTHKRAVFQSNGNFIVRDSFEGSGHHEYELHYHLHPDAIAKDDGQWWHIRRNNAVIHMKMLHGDSFQYVSGQERSLLGWYSPSYGLKMKCGVLCCRKAGLAREITFTTVIGSDGIPDIDELNALFRRMT